MKFVKKEINNNFTVDIEVEDTHNYQLENGIISHNTVSLLAGATPGVHFPQSRNYIRRIRISVNSDLVEPLKEAGYYIEPAVGSEKTTLVVEIPVSLGEKIRTINDVSMWEQLHIAAFMQRWWSDNQVSCTVSFDPKTEADQIEHALKYFQYELKGISFLPITEDGAYEQMPYESITKEQYDKMASKISPLNFDYITGEEAEVDKFCTDDHCLLEFEEEKVIESQK